MVVRAHRFREHVLNTSCFENGANTATRDQTGTRRRWLEEHLSTVVLTKDVVRDRVAFELHVDHLLVGVGRALLNRIWHLVGLAVTDPDLALAITNDGERSKTESATTLHNLRAAIDEDDLLDHLRAIARLFVVAIVAIIAALAASAAAPIWAAVKLTWLTRWSRRCGGRLGGGRCWG